MYDLARSCQELQEKCLIFSTEKNAEKTVQKTFQEKPRILSRNPRKSTRTETPFNPTDGPIEAHRWPSQLFPMDIDGPSVAIDGI